MWRCSLCLYPEKQQRDAGVGTQTKRTQVAIRQSRDQSLR